MGLNNIKQIESHISFIAKNDLPTSRFLQMSPQLHEKPVMSFADGKAIFFAGKSISQAFFSSADQITLSDVRD